jgi:hypothetical protein
MLSISLIVGREQAERAPGGRVKSQCLKKAPDSLAIKRGRFRRVLAGVYE